MDDHDYMRLTIKQAEIGVAAGQSPFGAIVVRNGVVIAATHNTVRRDNDPTAHAEVNALRRASSSLASHDLTGCVVYSTCEPCPMCLAAIHWSKADRVVFGATIADAQAAGFSEMPIAATTMVEMGQSPLRVEPGILAEECADLFRHWKETGHAQTY